MRISPLILLPWLTGCAGRIGAEVQIVQSEVIPTVFDVLLDFAGEPPDGAWVEIEDTDGATVRRRVSLSGRSGRQLALVGLRPVTSYVLSVVVEREGRERQGQGEEVTTGQIPAELPDIFVEEPGGGHFDGYLFTSLPGEPSGPLLLDDDGMVLWWFLPEVATSISRATLSRQGDTVIFAEVNASANYVNKIHWVSLDGVSYRTRVAPWMHHDFVELSDGTIAYLAYDPRELGDDVLLGDSVVELHPDGTREEVFNAWDHTDIIPVFPGEPLDDSLQESWEDDASPIDWSKCAPGLDTTRWPHANALAYLENEDAYLVSFLCHDLVLRIDRPSGEIDWVLGGPYGDFSLPDGERDFLERHHHLELRGDELLLFVNGDEEDSPARAEAYELDPKGGMAVSTWSYQPDPPLHVPTLGDVHRLPSGNVLVNFGYSGQIHEVTPDGALVWKLSTGIGGALGYTTVLDTLYPGEK